MKFKKIFPLICFMLFSTSLTIFAGKTDDWCSTEIVLDSTPEVEPGNGGQDYISSVWFSFYMSDNNYPHSYAVDISIYDWNGVYVEEVDGDSNNPNPSSEEATGLVDGTYTYLLDGKYKGTFDVNHNIKNEILIDLSYFQNCASEYSDEAANSEIASEKSISDDTSKISETPNSQLSDINNKVSESSKVNETETPSEEHKGLFESISNAFKELFAKIEDFFNTF